ncbi:UNVERIFIED_CONTAM: movement protein [Sesamum radiatum]|uniref:Movement protein n=1 Tax=Sesamum radiatum TaxID=300843 RepID=A0AAW2KPZ4_SESRA
MDLQPNQNNDSKEDRLQTSESLSGFFSRMTVSNKTMEKIMNKIPTSVHMMDSELEELLIPKEEILEELSRLREEIAVTMKWIHIGTIEVVIKATFKEGIDSEIHLSIMDRRINNLRDGCLGTMIGNLYAGKLMFDIHPRIAYNLADQDFSRVLTLHQDFKKKRSYERRKEYIEIPRIFKEFAKVMAPNPGRIPRIGGVDIVIKDHPVLDRTTSSRIEYSSRMSFSEDRIIGYKGKEKDLARVLTPQEIRQLVIGRYEGTLEIAGHEFLLQVLRREKAFNRIMPINFRSKRGDFDAKLTNPKMQDKRKFGKVLLSFRQQGLIDSDSFYEESKEEIKNLKEAMQELKSLDISEESKLSLENVKRLIQRNFSENPLAWWDRNKIEATLKLKEECKYEYVRYKPIQMNMEDKKDMQMIIKEHINLGLIEPGISAYSSPGFLVRNHGEIKRGILIDETGIELQEHIVEKIRNFPDVLKDKKHLQSFLGVVNFAGIFIKDLAKYRKDFRPLLKETESSKWKWEEIHTQRVRELKQICNNLPKLAIPQDEDELVVYTDANDYRWAAVLMKKTTTGEEPCRYTGGLFTEQQAQVWHINEKEFFAVWKAFKKWPLFLLTKEFTLKVDNTNVKAFLKNKLESKIEKARIIRWQAECQYYCYNIVVIKSHENVLADFLTRDGGI